MELKCLQARQAFEQRPKLGAGHCCGSCILPTARAERFAAPDIAEIAARKQHWHYVARIRDVTHFVAPRFLDT
eukprot:COSAG04_NODE_11367_length_713_cov_1.247557_1_plen_72_part_10